MKLSSQALNEAFVKGLWKAYRGNERMEANDIKVGPNSIDVTLHAKLLVPVPPSAVANKPLPSDFFPSGSWAFAWPDHVDPLDPTTLAWHAYTMRPEGVIVRPGDFILGAARERFDCDQPLALHAGDSERDASQMVLGGPSPSIEITKKSWFVQMYEGRSSCGRLGLASHITAGFGDYGFKGSFTLEIYNHSPFPLRIRPGMRIGQVAFEEISIPTAGYQGAYSGVNHNDGPVPPVLGPGRF